jgi:outer membrane protein assembly factor BamA/autotransporter translocation and assembly factor TamB
MPRISPFSSPRFTRRRWISAVAVLAAVLLVALALLSFGVYPRETVRRLVEARVLDALGPGSRVGSLRVVPARLQAEIRDAVLVGPGYRLELPRARARLKAGALLHGAVSLRSLELEAPDMVLTPTPAAAAGAAPPPELRPIHIEDLRVTKGRLVYRRPAAGELKLDGIEARGSIGGGALELTAAGGEWRRAVAGAPVVPIGRSTARGSLSEELNLKLEAADIGTDVSRVQMAGAVGPLLRPEFDLSFDAAVDAVDVNRLTDLPPSRGRLRAHGRVSGPLAGLKIRATTDAAGVMLAGYRFERLQATLEHDAAAATGRADGSAAAFGGQLRGTARLVQSRLNAQLDVQRVRFENLPPQARVPLAGTLSGRLDAHGDMEGSLRLAGSFEAAARDRFQGQSRAGGRFSGWLKLRSRSSDLEWRLSLDRVVGTRARRDAGSLRMTASGRATGLAPARIRGEMRGQAAADGVFGPSNLPFEGSFSLEGRRLRAAVASRGQPGRLRASLASHGAVIERLLAHGEAVGLAPFLGDGGGTLSFDADLRGAVERLSGTARARVAGLTYGDARWGDVSLDMQLRSGIGRTTFSAPALQARGRAEVRLAGNARVKGSLALDRTPLAMLAAAAPAGSRPTVDGEVSAIVDFDAPLRDLRRARVNARVSRLAAQSGEWSAQAANFGAGWADGVASVRDLALEMNGVRIEAEGRAGLRPRSADFSLRLAADLARLPLPAPWAAQGRAEGDLRLTGSLERPQLAGDFEVHDATLRRGTRQVVASLSHGRVRLERDRVAWDGLGAEVAGGRLVSSGHVPLAALVPALRTRRDGPTPVEEARIQAQWQGLRTESLLGILQPGQEQKFEAVLAGRLDVSGGLAAPLELRGELLLDPIAGRAGGMQFQLERVHVRAQDGVARIAETTLRSSGEVLRLAGRVDYARAEVDFGARGRLDLRALAPLAAAGVGIAGAADVDLRVGGALRAPRAHGRLALEHVFLRSREYPQAITDLSGTIAIDSGLIRAERLTARLGGGTLELAGSARQAGLGLADVEASLKARDVALHYPGELRSRVAADLSLGGRSGALRLGGEVHIERGLFEEDIYLDEALLRPRLPEARLEERSPLLRSVALDVQAFVDNPISIRNNLAELSVTGHLRVRGDLEEPAPFGRLEIAEGGVVFLQTRKFTVSSGTLIYAGTRDPTIAVRAETVIRQPVGEDVAVTVAAEGPLLKPELILTSDPSYSQREIASLIVTGRRGVALDSSAWVTGEQTAALLAGRLTRGLTRELVDLGLDEVDIQPELLARETDPGARFTFAKHLSPRVKLIYSFGLNDPEATFYQAEYRFQLWSEATARLQRNDGGDYSYGLGQRFRWGGAPPRRMNGHAAGRVVLQAVELAGDRPLPEPDLRRALDTQPGEEVLPFELQRRAEKLESLLVDSDFIEAAVSARVEGNTAIFDVYAGPHFTWEVTGFPGAPDVSQAIRGAHFEGEAIEQGRRRLLEAARARGHARAKVDAIGEGREQRRLVFAVDLGPALTLQPVRFPGARRLTEQQLLDAAGGAAELLAAPGAARKRIQAEYRRQHFLAAVVDEPLLEESADGKSLLIQVPVREGPRARIARVRFEGVSPPASVLLPLARIKLRTEYDDTRVQDAVRRIRDWYLKGGFAAARVKPRIVPVGSDIELVFAIDEGEPDIIGPVEVRGLLRTKESLVRSRIDFKEGDSLDPRRLVVLERRLLELGVFSRVVVTTTGHSPAKILVDVEERGPYALAYDVRFSPSERATAMLDGEVGNLLGLGIAAGARYRQGDAIRETRGSLVVPAIGRARGLTVSLFDTDERLDARRAPRLAALQPGFVADRVRQRGFEVQQSLQLRNNWDVLYGYRFKQLSRRSSGFTRNISSVSLSLARDTRDDPLDARRGAFWSATLEVAPRQLGSELDFARAFVQAFAARRINRSLTWAQGYRVGIASGLDPVQYAELQLFGRTAELFRAGGAASLRGYATDSVGPKGPVPGISAGGQAVLILNQELRFYHPTGLGAAVFYDGGNVSERPQDFSLSLRHSVGAGLRYRSPVGLLRFDVGVPLNRRPGDRSFQYFFSVGQAF